MAVLVSLHAEACTEGEVTCFSSCGFMGTGTTGVYEHRPVNAVYRYSPVTDVCCV